MIDEDLDYPEHIQPIHYRPVGDDGSDLWVVGCTACEAIMTARMDDAVWECACGVRTDPEPFRPRPAKPSRRIEYPAGRVLLRESQSPALPWWDHERNDKSVFETVSVRAFLTCHWVCPECELRFSEQVRTMTAYPPQCPDCRTKGGRSQVELDHYAAAVEVFGNARSGEPLEGTWASWRPDITVDVDGRTLVIEYDGAYWHTGAVRAAVDKRKSLDLLAAGCVVVRLRENDLPSLPIDNPRYREIQVHSTVPRPRTVMEEVRDWVAGLPRRQP